MYATNKKNVSTTNGPETNTSSPNNVNGDTSLTIQRNHQLQELVQRIKEVMTRKLRECCHIEELVIIDGIQRLGLEYYFQDEIRDALRKHYENYGRNEGEDSSIDPHGTALRFRLLRQQGYNVPADETFSKFKDEDGKFKQELGNDIKGLLSLFEASYLRIPGDHILDYAVKFSQNFLSSFKNVGPTAASIIRNILSHPCHKSLPRFMVSDFILENFEISMKLLHDCTGEGKWVSDVRNLVQIEIDIRQMTIKHEINQVCRWWEELGLPDKLKIARNEPVKWHMWSLVCLPGPNMSEQRVELTKAVSFIYIIDDIFDIYATLEELKLFTEAVNRWEYTNVVGLPDYMTLCLKALYETTDEMSYKIYDKYGLESKSYIQKVWAEYCDSCLVQAKWFASRHLPSVKEYIKHATLSTGVHIGCIHIFFLLGEASSYFTDLSSSHPDIVSSAATILRLWDDLGSAKDEKQKSDGSVVACYMNEHEGSSAETAREYVLTMISDEWSRLNKNLLYPCPFSDDYRAAIAHIARMVPVMYDYDENHSLPDLEKLMKPLLSANQ